ncbi:MAG: hypothetical protein IJ325_08115 [Clostridia bacterium]|nr:hypothetical protein [Clostridia bacterium]
MKCSKLLLSLLTAGLILCGCSSVDPKQESDTHETEVQAPGELCLFENGQAAYTIVQPDLGSDIVYAAGTLCWKTLLQNYNAELMLANDWTADPSAIPTDTLEILIGDTNRPESAEAKASLGNAAYRITCMNDRIVIVAAHEALLEQATAVFLENISADANGRVTVPGDLDITFAYEWPFPDLPVYENSNTLNIPFQETCGHQVENPSTLLGIADTTADEFNAYIQKVEEAGFTVVQRADWDSVIAYQCNKDDLSFYIYYTPNTKEVHIIQDNSHTASLEEFNYTCETEEGAFNSVFMFGMEAPVMDDDGSEIAGIGQLLFVKLADNSLLVIDGGHDPAPNSAEFMRLARELTGTPEGEKVRIACWFITHGHGDHIWGFNRILNEYADQLTLERIMYNHRANGPTIPVPPADKYPDILYHIPRTGETIQFGTLTMDVLYTHEDSVDTTYSVYTTDEYNDSSTVLRINFDGKTCIILGDSDKKVEEVLLNYYPEEQLKADVVQLAHHGINYLGKLYRAIDAEIALAPCQLWKYQYLSTANLISSISEEAYCCDETIGIRVTNGETDVYYRSPAVFND